MVKQSKIYVFIIIIFTLFISQTVHANFGVTYRIGSYPTWQISSGITVSMSNFGGRYYWGVYGGYGTYMPYYGGYSPFLPMMGYWGYRLNNPYNAAYRANLIRDMKQKEQLTRYALQKMNTYYKIKAEEQRQQHLKNEADNIQINITPDSELSPSGASETQTPKETTTLENQTVVMKTY